LRLLLVDDDSGLRALLRATFEGLDVAVDEAENAELAERRLTVSRPDVVVLDVRMPGVDGLELCRRLKSRRATRDIAIILLSGSEIDPGERRAAGADAVMTKPFSPLELLAVADRLAGNGTSIPSRPRSTGDSEEQLLLYARDLRHLLEVERRQRVLVEESYRETVVALTAALEEKDTRTRAHASRVQRYAVELARVVSSELAADPSAEYGYLLHDVGKIGVPDRILLKPGPLTAEERRVMESHTLIGERMLAGIAFLQGEAVRIVRSHHERWDGNGYPDRLAGYAIPLGARIFSLADALDAMTSDRPYRRALSWADARREVLSQEGKQFCPRAVAAFRACEDELRRASAGLVAA
jgi:response regulator RpfG family c-di-GMP phosphodiesterase